MTTASIRTITHQTHGVDRVALSVGLALVTWGRTRAERTAVSRDEHRRRVELERSIASREHATLRYGIIA